MAREGILFGCRWVRGPLCFSPAALSFLSPSRETLMLRSGWKEGQASCPQVPVHQRGRRPGRLLVKQGAGLRPSILGGTCWLPLFGRRQDAVMNWSISEVAGPERGCYKEAESAGLCESSVTVKAVAGGLPAPEGHRAVMEHRGGIRRGGFRICRESCSPTSPCSVSSWCVWVGEGRTPSAAPGGGGGSV